MGDPSRSAGSDRIVPHPQESCERRVWRRRRRNAHENPIEAPSPGVYARRSPALPAGCPTTVTQIQRRPVGRAATESPAPYSCRPGLVLNRLTRRESRAGPVRVGCRLRALGSGLKRENARVVAPPTDKDGSGRCAGPVQCDSRRRLEVLISHTFVVISPGGRHKPSLVGYLSTAGRRRRFLPKFMISESPPARFCAGFHRQAGRARGLQKKKS